MDPTASPLLCVPRRGGIRLHGLRTALSDTLEPHPLGVRHSLLRLLQLEALGHELSNEALALLLLEFLEPLRAPLLALRTRRRWRIASRRGGRLLLAHLPHSLVRHLRLLQFRVDDQAVQPNGDLFLVRDSRSAADIRPRPLAEQPALRGRSSARLVASTISSL